MICVANEKHMICGAHDPCLEAKGISNFSYNTVYAEFFSRRKFHHLLSLAKNLLAILSYVKD